MGFVPPRDRLKDRAILVEGQGIIFEEAAGLDLSGPQTNDKSMNPEITLLIFT